ncbi:helix-turn-helix domain-containing protein [Arcobacter arenosus]|uniref:helix-turn-helix domain-containing protein n=1 Tax=Arcobacter arenosus TaxID=2576037 RepID=UPI003BA8F056
MDKDFITPLEASELTGHTIGALSNLRTKKEKFPFYKIGRKIFYKKSEILALMESGKVEVNQESK